MKQKLMVDENKDTKSIILLALLYPLVNEAEKLAKVD